MMTGNCHNSQPIGGLHIYCSHDRPSLRSIHGIKSCLKLHRITNIFCCSSCAPAIPLNMFLHWELLFTVNVSNDAGGTGSWCGVSHLSWLHWVKDLHSPLCAGRENSAFSTISNIISIIINTTNDFACTYILLLLLLSSSWLSMHKTCETHKVVMLFNSSKLN